MVGAWAAVTAEELALALAYRARRVVLVVVVHALVARRCLLVLVRAVPAAPALAPPITPAVVALAVVVLVGLQRVLLVAVIVVTIAVRTLGPALLFLLLVILVVLLSAPPLLRRSHRLTRPRCSRTRSPPTRAACRWTLSRRRTTARAAPRAAPRTQAAAGLRARPVPGCSLFAEPELAQPEPAAAALLRASQTPGGMGCDGGGANVIMVRHPGHCTWIGAISCAIDSLTSNSCLHEVH